MQTGPGLRRLRLLVTCTAMMGAIGTALATPPPGRYQLSSGVVHDTVTRLSWQQQVPSQHYSWNDASSYCASLSLGGVSGWRLPAVKELASIVDIEAGSPAIDSTAFPNTPADRFWTATPVASDPGSAWWYVNFGAAPGQSLIEGPYDAGNTFYVRCVR